MSLNIYFVFLYAHLICLWIVIRFQRTGVTDAVLVTLNLYMDTPVLLTLCCCVVSALSRLPAHISQLTAANACEGLKEVLENYSQSEPSPLRDALTALVSICTGSSVEAEANRERFGVVEIAETLTK